MALSLTCACGARFELEDTLAGQEVSCPECQQPLQAPALQRLPLQTSMFAIASVILALVGAFTVVGTIAAVILGIVALIEIARRRDRVAGTGFAAFGIIAGTALTVVTVLALCTGELFGLGGSMRQVAWAEQLDRNGPMEIIRKERGFAITRPTEKWGVALNNQIEGEPILEAIQKNRDLVLVQPAFFTCVDVRVDNRRDVRSLDDLGEPILRELQGDQQQPMNKWGNPDPEKEFKFIQQVKQVGTSKDLPKLNGVAGKEMLVDMRCAGQPWEMVIRYYKLDDGKLFIVRGYSKKRFTRGKDEIQQALDSFQILQNK
jgi:hypothetical protein